MKAEMVRGDGAGGAQHAFLITFVGNRDPYATEDGQYGPVLSLLSARAFSHVFLIYTGDVYLEIARTVQEVCKEVQPETHVNFVPLELASPVDYEEIYRKLSDAVAVIVEKHRHAGPHYSVLIDPGTPQMQTVWFLLVKSGFFGAQLLQGVPAQFAGGAYKVREIDLSSPAFPDIRIGRQGDAAMPGYGDAGGPGDRAVANRTPSTRPNGSDWIVAGSRDHMIGEASTFTPVLEAAGKVSTYEVSVLIRGEPGTGKGMFARFIHDASSRRDGPFLSINCASITATLAESELFGHVRGAFTGAETERLGQIRAADGGTIFLDEIGDLPMEIQPKLLRVLEHKRLTPVGRDKEVPVDVRVVSATNRDLEALIHEGRFRRDLYDRLAQFTITAPPLRDRPSDIPLLVRSFVAGWNAQYRESKSIDDAAMQYLLQYPWPGNIRELQNSVTQMCASASGNHIPPELLPPAIRAHFQAGPTLPEVDFRIPEDGLNLPALLFNIEKEFYVKALERTGGNRERAAGLLGLNGPAFRKAMKERFGM